MMDNKSYKGAGGILGKAAAPGKSGSSERDASGVSDLARHIIPVNVRLL